MWILIAAGVAGSSCVQDVSDAMGTGLPTTVRGTMTYAGESGTFVQHVDGDRVYVRIETDTYRDTDLFIGEDHWNVDSNGRLSHRKAAPHLLATHLFEPDLTGFVAEDDQCEAVRFTSADGRTMRFELGEGHQMVTRTLPHACFPTTTTITSADFRDVDGVNFPFSMRYETQNGVFAELNVQSVVRSVPAGAFAPLEDHTDVRFEAGPLDVPMRVYRERIYISVVLSGLQEQVTGWMMLDTGWAGLSIDSDVVEKIGWDEGGWNWGSTPTGKVTRSTGRLQGMRVGGMVFDRPMVSTMPLLEEIAPGVESIGVFGMGAMGGLVVTIDYPGRRVRFSPPGDPAAQGEDARLEMPTLCGTPAVRATLGSVEGMWGIDTGAFESFVKLDGDAFDALLKTYPGAERASITTASGGSDDVWHATLEEGRIGPHKIDSPGLLLIRAQPTPYTPLVGKLGHRFLHCFVVTMDFSAGTLLLRPGADLDTCAHAPTLPYWGLRLSDLLCLMCLLLPPLGALGLGVELWRRRGREAKWAELD